MAVKSKMRKVLEEVLAGARSVTLKAGNQLAEMYAVTISPETAGLIVEYCNPRNRAVRQRILIRSGRKRMY